ncbi:MAG: hypothetical protein JWM77_4144 [Rhodospirillales bacterium]|nr:hypothetical protein [Rhodospirillales bacterium]
MKALAVIGIVLMLGGVAALAIGGFSFTSKETVAKIGPLDVQADRERGFYIPPIAAVAAIVVGGALVFAGRSSRN